MTHYLLNASLLLFAAAITPGPNNYLVLQAASASGAKRAWALCRGVVAGSALMLILANLGLAAVVSANPPVKQAMTFAGAAYLIWLGFTQIRAVFGTPAGARVAANVPGSAWRMAAFQFVNPKAWVLVVTLATAAPEPAPLGRGPLIAAELALVVLVSSACLAVWVGFGQLIAHTLRDESIRRFAETAMGLVLVASAALLVV